MNFQNEERYNIQYTNFMIALNHLINRPQHRWSSLWLRAYFLQWLSFFNPCCFLFPFVFSLERTDSGFVQRSIFPFEMMNSSWCSIFYGILSKIETFFRRIDEIRSSLFLRFNSFFHFILNCFQINLPKLHSSLLNAMLNHTQSKFIAGKNNTTIDKLRNCF